MRFIQRAKRRHWRAGIYLVRTRRHLGAGRVNGYVGRSNDIEARRLCHLGMCRHATCHAKPWTDLDPRWWSLRLPWWLSWKWVQAAFEAFAIWILAPLYNVQLNTKNPRRVPPHMQRLQRASRDAGRPAYRTAARIAQVGRRVVQGAAGAAAILVGLFMTVWTHR